MLFTDTYQTISAPGEGQFKDRGSRFIGLAFPVSTETEIKDLLAKLKKEYHDARHLCYSYIIGPDKAAYRINDDGEPSGTAGRPIYNVLLSNDLTNTLVVVIRYFGGVKLGVPGLINAYKSATIEALNATQKIEKIVYEVYQIEFGYLVMNDIMRLVKDYALTITQSNFDLNCSMEVMIRRNDAISITSILSKVEGTSVQFLRMI